jgi:hypothetical protein
MKSSLTALIVIAVAVVSGCGQQPAGSGGSGALGSGSPPVTVGGTGSCQGKPTARRTVTVSASDNGKAICVKPGTGVLVMLRGTPTRKWAPIHATSGVLSPRPNGRLSLQLGVTGAYFVAAHTGTAIITSARPVCPPAKSTGSSPSAGPGTMQCDSLLAFHATVKVRS